MRKSLLRARIVLAALVFSLLLAACEEAEAEIFVDLALDWAHEKGLVACIDPAEDPATCPVELTGDFYAWAAGEGAEQMTEGTVLEGLGKFANDMVKPKELDQGAQDVLDTARVAKTIAEADALAEQGFEEGDQDKITQAIAMREGDWSYNEMLGVLFLAENDEHSASQQQNEAEEKAIAHLRATLEADQVELGDEQAHRACVATYFNLYKQREEALLAQINKMMDADPPQDAEFLIRHLDLVRSKMAELEENPPGSPCYNWGPN